MPESEVVHCTSMSYVTPTLPCVISSVYSATPVRGVSASRHSAKARCSPSVAAASPCRTTSSVASDEVLLAAAPRTQDARQGPECQHTTSRLYKANTRTAGNDRACVVVSTRGHVLVPVQELHRPRGHDGVCDHAVRKLDAVRKRQRLSREVIRPRRPVCIRDGSGLRTCTQGKCARTGDARHAVHGRRKAVRAAPKDG